MLFLLVASFSGEGGLYLWHSPNPLNLWCQSPCGLGYMIAWFLQARKASAKRKLHSWPHDIFFNIHVLSVFLDLFFSLLLCLCLCSSSSYYYCVLIFLLLCYFYRSLLLFFAHCSPHLTHHSGPDARLPRGNRASGPRAQRISNTNMVRRGLHRHRAAYFC